MNQTDGMNIMTGTAKRLLRDKYSQLYFTGNAWTADPNKAQLFGQQLEAVRACMDHKLRNVELVVRMETCGPDMFSVLIC